MHALKPIFSATRLARYVRWALLLAKYALFLLTDTREARRHVRKMRRCVTHIVMAHALNRVRGHLVAPQGRCGAPRGFAKRRIRNSGLIFRAALAPLRRSLRRGDTLETLCALFSAIWFVERSASTLMKRLARRLTRLAPLILTHAHSVASPLFAAPTPAPADSS